MFCALNGATLTPCRASQRHIPAVSTLLPASEVVPATSRAPLTVAPPPARLPPRARDARPASRADDPTARDSRTARPMSAGRGAGPSPAAPASRCARRSVRPPSRTPSAPRRPPRTARRSGWGGGRRRGAARAPLRAAAADDRGEQHGKRGGQPRRDDVGEVVEAGRGPAEPLVARAPMPDHRVQGVDRAVGRATPGSPRGRPRPAARPRRRWCSRPPTRPPPAPARRRPGVRVAAAQGRQEGPGAFDAAVGKVAAQSVATRASDSPPTTLQVATAVRAARHLAFGLPEAGRPVARGRLVHRAHQQARAPRNQAEATRRTLPRRRESAYRAASIRAAAWPKPATGCARRGSATTRSAA